MLKFKGGTKEGGTVLGFGLTRPNIERLVAGEAIKVIGSDWGMPHLDVIILYGENEKHIIGELRHAGAFPEARVVEEPTTDGELGPTGKFPRGHLGDEDEGELRVGVSVDPETKTIVIDFGKPTAWIGMDAGMAEDLAALLQKHVDGLREATEGES